MQNAIHIIFPETRHRWCLWHILEKLPDKFGGHMQKGSILLVVHYVVYESQSPEEFENGGRALIYFLWICTLENVFEAVC